MSKSHFPLVILLTVSVIIFNLVYPGNVNGANPSAPGLVNWGASNPLQQINLSENDEPDAVDAQTKIEPTLQKEFIEGRNADIMIWLAEKADLSAAYEIRGKVERGQYVYETLRETADRSQASLRAYLDSLGMDYKAFYISNKILVYQGTQQLLTSLSMRPDVVKLTSNHYFLLEEPEQNTDRNGTISSIGENISFIHADQVWDIGITGQNTVLAGNDTGLDWEHPAIKSHYRGWDGFTADHNYNWWDATRTYPNAPEDGGGHGTHTTGTMVGDDGSENQIGVAPGAKTIHCKNMDDFGGGYDEWFIECFQWDLAPWDLNGQNPSPALAPDAVNNSWGYGGGNYPVFTDEIAALQAAGILVEVSAGNEGPGCGTLRSPGDYGEVLTTGSVSYVEGTLPGSLSYFSSRGPSLLSTDALPDVLAPGEFVRSAVPGGGYEYWDGTSMAGPHVTGLIGLLWDANPGLRGMIPETQQILYSTSVPLTGETGSNCGGDYELGPNNDWGYGTIDAFAAVQAAIAFGGIGMLEGTVTDAESGAPLAGVEIQAQLTPDLIWRIRTDENGHYARLVFEGVYNLHAQLYGYYPVDLFDIEVNEDGVTIVDFSLDPSPTYTVSGVVSDSLSGWPLYAQLDIRGYPFDPIWTNPATGEYQIDLAAGIEYTFTVSAWSPGYHPTSEIIEPLTGPEVHNFSLDMDSLACSAPGYQPDYVYYQGFEEGDGGFIADGSWEWGIPRSGPGNAHAGINVWATNLLGHYSDNEYSTLSSPDIDLSGFSGEAIIISWWQWLKTEAGFDNAWVEVSNDGGANWMWIYGDTGEVDTIWTKHNVILDPSFAVENFRVRFTLSTDGSVTEDGYYIDDLGIGIVSVPANLYFEDFEANDGGYIESGDISSWAWGTPLRGVNGAHSGTNVWATNLNGNYRNNENSSITSPILDLSGSSEDWLELSWWQWLQTESGYDTASVEVFDGSTWTEVYSASGTVNSDWERTSVLLENEQYGNNNIRVRFNLSADDIVNYPGFYVDDVIITPFNPGPPSVPCLRLTGGLVMGNTYDGNTGLPVNGVSVSAASGQTISMETIFDEGVDDGFYTLFMQVGEQELRATKTGYGESVLTVNVLADENIWQDIQLNAGLLNLNVEEINVEVDMGNSLVQTIQLENLGQNGAGFELFERAGEYSPLNNPAAYIPGNQHVSDQTGLYTGQASVTMMTREAWVYTPPASTNYTAAEASVLLLIAAESTQIQAMLQAYPDLSPVDYFDPRFATPSLDDLLQYDAVIVGANNPFADPIALGNILADYIDAGGKVIQTVPTFYDPGGNGWGIRGRFYDEGYSPFAGTGDWFSWADLGSFDPSHPIMEGVSYVGDYFRQVVELSPDAEWVASWTDDEFVATKENVVAVNAFLPDGYLWSGELPLILHNSIIWLVLGQDVTWLSADPVSGMVAAGDQQEISVNLDSSVPEIDQPGTYTASLRVLTDTPYQALILPVSMNVNPPATWGRITGVVSGLSCFASEGAPIDHAMVDIQDVAQTATGSDGTYSYWLAPGSYKLKAIAAGYVEQEEEILVTSGEVSNWNFVLQIDAPCTEGLPDSINMELPIGVTNAIPIELSNLGGAALKYNWLESPVDLTIDFGEIHQTRPRFMETLQEEISGPTSVRSMLGNGMTRGRILAPSSGWFGAYPVPNGLIRYAFAQCPEQPESFYVFAGIDAGYNLSTKTWRYDTDQNEWTELAQMPAGGEAPAAACFQGKVYLLGGSGTAQFFIYDIAKNEWAIGPDLPRPVEGAASAAWGGKIYLVGGDDDFMPENGVFDQVDVFDLTSGNWEIGASMPVAASNSGYVQIGHYLYVVGGWGENSPTENVNVTQRYDMVADNWVIGPDFTSARADFALAATNSGLYAAGGDDTGNFFFDATDTLERLDVNGFPVGEWLPVSDPLPLNVTANNAGFCTMGLLDSETAEIWSVGRLDPSWGIVSGDAYFLEQSNESCYSIYSDVDWLQVEPQDGEVLPGEQQSARITIDTSGLAAGEYQATLVWTSNDTIAAIRYIPVNLIVLEPNYDFEIQAQPLTGYGAAGLSVEYGLQLTNIGNVPDQYSVELLGNDWPANSLEAIEVLTAGGSFSWQVTVEIPYDTPIWSRDSLIVRVTSTSDASIWKEIRITTIVGEPFRQYLSVISK